MIQLPPDFKEFLKLLNEHEVEYLLVGGHAVGFHGYPRPNGDLDIWIALHETNAARMVEVLRAFSWTTPQLSPQLFLDTKNTVRMGTPPLRIEILNRISGVSFDKCYARRVEEKTGNIVVNIISEDDLKRNKRTSGRHKTKNNRVSGRHKDLHDLEQL